MDDLFIVGKVIGAHGIRGEIKIYPLTDHADRFQKLSECMLLSPAEKFLRNVQVKNSRSAGPHILLTIDGISDRDEAQKMNGLFLAVKREDAAPLPSGHYYINDLKGCTVQDAEHGILGILSEVLQTGANDVFIVKRSGKPDLLIPYLLSVVSSVDVPLRTITVQLPDGLYEIYDQ